MRLRLLIAGRVIVAVILCALTVSIWIIGWNDTLLSNAYPERPLNAVFVTLAVSAFYSLPACAGLGLVFKLRVALPLLVISAMMLGSILFTQIVLFGLAGHPEGTIFVVPGFFLLVLIVGIHAVGIILYYKTMNKP